LHPSTIWRKKLRKKLKKEYGNICNYPKCDSTDRLEFAHICNTKLCGQGRGSKERIRDVRDNPHAYVLLCHRHHSLYDSMREFEKGVIDSTFGTLS